MATSFTPEPFEDWGASQQDLWSNFVDESGHAELWQDDTVMAFYDVAFNSEKGEIAGDERAAIMAALIDYIDETYDINFYDVFDWEAWREIYE